MKIFDMQENNASNCVGQAIHKQHKIAETGPANT